MHVLFTLGYQGHSIASFLEVLLAHGITTVIDVRERPYSRAASPTSARSG